MNKIKLMLRKLGIKTIVIMMTIGAVLLGFIAVAVKTINRRRRSPGNIDINEHVNNLEDKINEWQNYLDNNPAPRRR